MTPSDFIYWVDGLIQGKYDDTSMRIRRKLEEMNFFDELSYEPENN